jgi:hypothetical protein
MGLEFEDAEGFYDEEIAKKSASDYVNVTGVDNLGKNILAMQTLAQKARSNATNANIAQREEYFDIMSAQRLGAMAKTMPEVDVIDGRIMYDTNPGFGTDFVPIETLPSDNPLYQTFVNQPGSGPFGLITDDQKFVPGIQSGGVIKYRPQVEAVVESPVEPEADSQAFEGFEIVK